MNNALSTLIVCAGKEYTKQNVPVRIVHYHSARKARRHGGVGDLFHLPGGLWVQLQHGARALAEDGVQRGKEHLEPVFGHLWRGSL
jgi:hypothetical protein